MVKKHDSSVRVLTVVLTVAFGLIAAVIAYATFKGGSFELRSKAATEEIILKQWTFDSNAEGWEAKDFLSNKIESGMYKLTVNPSRQIAETKQECDTNSKNEKQKCRTVRIMRELNPLIQNSSVQTNLLYPVNKFRIRLAVSNPTISERPRIMMVEESARSKGEKQVAPTKAYPFVMKISQKYQGKTLGDTEQQISAIADGKEHEYSFVFSRASTLKRVDELQIQFVSLPQSPQTVVLVNEIAIIGMKEVRPTITKVPPSNVQTLNGFVRKYEGVVGSASQYRLVVPPMVIGETRSRPPQPVYSKEQEYLLTQSSVSPCGGSRGAEIVCKYIVRPTRIDFSVYLDKYVTATGTILQADGTRVVADPRLETRATTEGITYEDNLKIPRFPAPTPMPLPTFVVSAMRLVSTPSTSPTPISCGVGLKEFVPGKSTTCSSGYYLGMSYSCFGGISGGTDLITCMSYDSLRQQAIKICAGSTNCPETTVRPTSPTPTDSYPPSPYPSTSVIQYPTSTPPPYTSIMYTPTPTMSQ